MRRAGDEQRACRAQVTEQTVMDVRDASVMRTSVRKSDASRTAEENARRRGRADRQTSAHRAAHDVDLAGPHDLDREVKAWLTEACDAVAKHGDAAETVKATLSFSCP